MPSSSWRLIKPAGGSEGLPAAPDLPGVPTAPEYPGAPTAPGYPGAAAPESSAAPDAAAVSTAVFRGRGRATNRSAAPQAPALLASAAGGPASPLDQPEFVEEMRRVERMAEERGYETGRRRAESELRAAIEGATAMADRLSQLAPDRTADIAHAISELALTVAKRIIQHEVRIEPSLLCASLEAAVSTINGSPEAHVLLNPAAVEPVREAWEALHGRAYLGKKWFFEGDPTLPIGGCTLRYDHGFVEAGLEAQLEEIGIALDRAIPSLSRNDVDEDVA